MSLAGKFCLPVNSLASKYFGPASKFLLASNSLETASSTHRPLWLIPSNPLTGGSDVRNYLFLSLCRMYNAQYWPIVPIESVFRMVITTDLCNEKTVMMMICDF